MLTCGLHVTTSSRILHSSLLIPPYYTSHRHITSVPDEWSQTAVQHSKKEPAWYQCLKLLLLLLLLLLLVSKVYTANIGTKKGNNNNQFLFIYLQT
jgi:hypothetical protein